MSDYPAAATVGVNYLPYILFGVVALLSWLVQINFQSKFKRYSQILMSHGMTGRQVAERMLRDNGITDVSVISTPGQLTDHYNPQNKTVNLSEAVYASNSVAAAAVAAHECGHAVQHATAYGPLQMFPGLLLFGIILFALTTLFSIITLPVEINASQRAIAWLSNTGVTNYETDGAAKGALKAAAYTYIIAALGSLATLFYYLMIFLGRRSD